jgi:hypothetical protein
MISGTTRIVVLDPQRKIIAANDAFLQRTGSVREKRSAARAAT